MRVVKQSVQKGFTLVEMLVVAPIVILAIGAFLTVIISMTGQVLASRASNSLSYNVQDALNHIEQDVKMSSAFLATNAVLGDSQGYNDDTTAFTNVAGASGTSLILSMVATTANPVSTSSSYVYLKNQPNDCSAPQNNIPFTYNIVYFVKDSVLYRRTIMPANYNDTTNTVCSVPWQQPSCSAAYMAAHTGSTFCKTQDVELVDGVDPGNFTIQYFNNEASTVVNEPASTASSVDARGVALQSATTVGVSINAEQTVAGQSIERSAILRASRLDSNASGIAVITADGIPAAPKVSSTVSAPTNVTFSWPKVPTATGYTIKYKINSGSWVTGFTNQALQTYTVTNATHQDVVSAQVTAINSAGSSGNGTSTATVPLWTPASLQNGWVDYSPPYTSAAYTKTSAGIVVLKGLIRAGTTASGTVIMNLPVGYRPSAMLVYSVTASSTVGRIAIAANGDVTSYGTAGANASYTSFDGISFVPSGSPYTLTGVPLVNSWTNFGNGYSDLVSTIDSAGRVNVQGNIKNGSVTGGTPMAQLPAGSIPPAYAYFPAPNSSGTFGFMMVNSTGGIEYRSGGNSFQSPIFKFYPSSRPNGTDCTTSWCTIPLSSGWVAYDVARTPSYTKGSDGIVSLRGLGKNGTTTGETVLGTLPAGYRPAERLIITSVCNSSYCRLDILPDGTIHAETGVSASWTAFDSVQFMAEK